MKQIYLDHNATTPVDPVVLESLLPYLRSEYGNPSSGHPLGRRAKEAIDVARNSVADLIGARSDEIVFTSGGTEASQLGLIGAAERLRAKKPDGRLRAISFALEHPATIRPLEQLSRRGDEVRFVPADENGVARLDPFIEAIDSPEPVDIASLMHAHNETGAIQPVEDVGRAARENGVIFHVDAAQSVGKLEVDVDSISCDLLTIAGHKLYAPKGIGALYVRSGTEIAPLIPGAGQESGLRGGTENVAGIVALGTACRLAAERLAARDPARLAELRDRFWNLLQRGIPGIARTSHGTETLPNTLHVRFPGTTGDAVLDETPDVAASTGSACHAGSTEPPAAITALGVPEKEALGSVRLSLGHGTDTDAIDTAADLLIKGWNRAIGGNTDESER